MQLHLHLIMLLFLLYGGSDMCEAQQSGVRCDLIMRRNTYRSVQCIIVQATVNIVVHILQV